MGTGTRTAPPDLPAPAPMGGWGYGQRGAGGCGISRPITVLTILKNKTILNGCVYCAFRKRMYRRGVCKARIISRTGVCCCRLVRVSESRGLGGWEQTTGGKGSDEWRSS